MRSKFLFIILIYATHAHCVVGQVGIEQYFYGQKNMPITWVPIVHAQNEKKWYVEARYNYEEYKAFSLYGGKNFEKEGNVFSYSLTPLIGGVVGAYKGASLGLNVAIEVKDFFFSSQSQFTFSSKACNPDFLFSWLELGLEPLHWFYIGGSLQHTYYTETYTTEFEPGVMMGFNAGNWSFPMYAFSLGDASRYFVLGIILAIGPKKLDR